MPAPLVIGTLSARTGRSIHAIRWYEAQGRVPGVRRDAGGRRLYTEQHVGWLRFMERLRRTGKRPPLDVLDFPSSPARSPRR
jgi:DNA-binding transcriptional MerR regulator